jgi:hypothetical protein
MPRQTKRELLEENDELRSKLEDIYSQIGEVLDIEDDDSADEPDSEEEGD